MLSLLRRWKAQRLRAVTLRMAMDNYGPGAQPAHLVSDAMVFTVWIAAGKNIDLE